MRKIKTCWFVGALLFFFAAYTNISAQVAKDSLVSVYFNAAKTKIVEEKYDDANSYFKKIFALKSPVPDELAYYYGYNLLKLKKYVQSREAILKYIKLKGEKGTLYTEALSALDELDCAETGYKEVEVECDLCHGDTLIIECSRCRGIGKEVCPICGGTGVAVSAGNFGTNYHTCHRCNGNKIVTCSVCDGLGKVMEICRKCRGKGKVKEKKKC